jgi:hypothetical protein
MDRDPNYVPIEERLTLLERQSYTYNAAIIGILNALGATKETNKDMTVEDYERNLKEVAQPFAETMAKLSDGLNKKNLEEAKAEAKAKEQDEPAEAEIVDEPKPEE